MKAERPPSGVIATKGREAPTSPTTPLALGGVRERVADTMSNADIDHNTCQDVEVGAGNRAPASPDSPG